MKPEESLSQKTSETPPQGKGKPLKRIGLLLLVLALAVSALLWSRISPSPRQGRQDFPPSVVRAPVRGNPVVPFDPFLIPLGETSKYTFISLSFSVELPNGQSGKEWKEQMSALRGFIYDRLKEDFQKEEGIPLVQSVKDGVDRAVRLKLPGQQVKEIYISQFLAL
jgi:flagellar basal body-associated protein FliL